MDIWRCVAVLCAGILSVCSAQVFYITAPNTLRLDSEETIAIAVDGNSALVNLYIQDHPGKVKNLTQKLLTVRPGQPEIVKVNLDPASFPPNFFNAKSDQFVSLTVHSDAFHKEVRIPVSNQAGYVFIQTDKPIYTPKDKVHLRIISLNENGLPSGQPFKLQIKNPKGIIVEEKKFNKLPLEWHKVFERHRYDFPTYPVLGEWTATVYYGYQLQQNTKVHFDLDEYVLPTFTIDLKTPDVILESQEKFSVTVNAKYVYGKKVEGKVTFRMGVKGSQPLTTFFAVFGPNDLVEGSYTLVATTKSIATHKDIGWFPEIEGSHLVVEAAVTEGASGVKELATDSECQFAKSPFHISFKRCLQDFKPGLMSVFEADINYVGGGPAGNVPTHITALADGKDLRVNQNTATSDAEGKVVFQLHPEMHHQVISITLETLDPRFPKNQAVGRHIQNKFQSSDNAYIALDRSTKQKHQLGDMFLKTVYFEPVEMSDVYYVVVSKGKIVEMNKLPEGKFKNQKVEFEITHEMIPAFRIVVFSHYKEKLLADSLNIDVENSCHPKAEVTMKPEFGIKEPGNNGEIVIHGTSETVVGLLGIDEAVYAMSRKDVLTKNRVFKAFTRHDLGCGPGGGINTDRVLANAGITIATNSHTPAPESASSCVAVKRRKRSIASEKVSTYTTPLERECCSLGLSHDKHNRDCLTRTNVVQRHLAAQYSTGQYDNCSRAFLQCCLHAEKEGLMDMKVARSGHRVSGRMGIQKLDIPEFIHIDDEEGWETGLTVRSIFSEQWFFEDITIGPDGKEQFRLSLPHSITTWVISAVSVSPTYGICVAEPQKIVSFKKVFLQLSLPYSVVRNEQIEIQATIFNYGDRRLSAILYMYGVKDLCTGAVEGEKSERKRLVVEGQSSKAVAFPLIPLQAGVFDLKVVALSPEGSDVVVRKLNVVPEGEPVEIHIPIKLDPSNMQRRTKRHITTDMYDDSIDTTLSLQVTAIKLPIPKDFVPGTESCIVQALGDHFGPIVETALNNPESLLRMPHGCGEQNMMFLAPTLYTMRYLKTKGKVTPENEEKGYAFIRKGYGNQLTFRKDDGSYAAYQSTPTSVWLTAFVLKVFCQASELVHIDQKVLCSGLEWLQEHQEPDGSFVESRPVYHTDMMGGVQGKVPLTAFVLISLEECSCDSVNLHITKKRALSFLEEHLGEVKEPLAVAIVAYALALSDSVLRQGANDRLLAMARYDEDQNLMHWGAGENARDIEATAYALLTQLLSNDMTRGNSIVNWLNLQQLQSGAFQSTQDTVVALQALSEFAIRSQMPAINLVANITSSNDRNFQKVLSFDEANAQVLKNIKVDKVGGMLFVKTAGHGMGSLAVKLRYNLPHSPEKLCKFDVTVNVSEVKEANAPHSSEEQEVGGGGRHDVFHPFPPDLIRGVAESLDANDPVFLLDPRNRGQRSSLILPIPPQRKKRDAAPGNSKLILKVSICARYLGNKNSEMSIVDVGIFSGFVPDKEDLKELQDDPSHLIEKYEISSKGIVFYLKTVPIKANYCFDFHVTREFMVGNTQSSVVKVYDYYNPEEICTKFYSPGNNSPMLQTICEGGVCQCAEGGCPPKNPFDATKNMKRTEKRNEILHMACENYDFVWLVTMVSDKKEEGFINITFQIEDVIKEGIEKASMLEGDVRSFLARDNCESAKLFAFAKYLIMGRDGQKYESKEGTIWYRYLLDKMTAVHLWTERKVARDKELQGALDHVTRTLKNDGCAM